MIRRRTHMMAARNFMVIADRTDLFTMNGWVLLMGPDYMDGLWVVVLQKKMDIGEPIEKVSDDMYDKPSENEDDDEEDEE